MFRTIVLFGFFAVLAIVAFTTGNLRTVAQPGNTAGLVVGFIFFASILFLTITRQWTAEFDLDTRRLRISHRTFGRWKREIVDCSLDECSALGTIAYNNDGHVSYGVYVQLKPGARHAIPIRNPTWSEAADVASQLSAATGIPRLDTTTWSPTLVETVKGYASHERGTFDEMIEWRAICCDAWARRWHKAADVGAEAQRDIFAYIKGFYNNTRRHSAIGYIRPIEMKLKAA